MKRNICLLIAVVLCCTLLFGCGAKTAAEESSAGSSGTDAKGLVEDIVTIQAFTQDAVPDADIQTIVMAGINAPSAMNGQPWHFSVVTSQTVLQEIAGGMGGGMPSAGGKPDEMPEGAGKPEGMPEGAEMPEGMPEGAEKPEGMPERVEKPEGMPEGFQMPQGGQMPAAPGGNGAKAGISDAPLVIIVSCKEGSDLDAGLATQNMSVEAQLLGYGTKIISSPKMALNGSRQAEYKELLGIPEDMSAVCMLLIGKADTEIDGVTGATERNALEEVATFVK